MPQLKRATVYLDPSLHKALRVKAAHTGCSISELVNTAVRQTFAEDAQDLAIFAERAKEPALSFEDVLKDPPAIRARPLRKNSPAKRSIASARATIASCTQSKTPARQSQS